MRILQISVLACLTVAALGCGDDSPSTPISPSPTSTSTTTTTTVAPVTVTGITVSGGTVSFDREGATAQFNATAALSNGSSEDRTGSVTWTSENTSVATVSSTGVVTARGDGTTNIVAALNNVRGTRGVSVRIVRRTPDPAAGQRLPLPANAQQLIQQIAGARPELIRQSCDRGLKYVLNPWINYMVDELRKTDTRWGYNAKPNRSAADNNGVPVQIAGDEITYHFGPGPDEGSTDVYPIDILQDHCGNNPTITFRVFTGEEPVRWTGAGRF